MRLTRKKAISITDEQWEHLAETGGDTFEKMNWMIQNYGRMKHDCALCEYAERKTEGNTLICRVCPYYQTFGSCFKGGILNRWLIAASVDERKEIAQEAVAQLKQLR